MCSWVGSSFVPSFPPFNIFTFQIYPIPKHVNLFDPYIYGSCWRWIFPTSLVPLASARVYWATVNVNFAHIVPRWSVGSSRIHYRLRWIVTEKHRVTLDMSKAFDWVWQKGPLVELNEFEFPLVIALFLLLSILNKPAIAIQIDKDL